MITNRITDVFTQPDLRRKRLTVTVATSQRLPVRVQIEGTPHGATGEPGTLLVDFPDHRPWSPESPQLYTLRCDLLQGEEVVDCARVRFAMREFTVRNTRFYLNNRPCFVKGVLHHPEYPASIAAAESEELARLELMRAKEAGFNLVWLRGKPAPEITLDLADELGLLIGQELPISCVESLERMPQQGAQQLREIVLRDRNHPSVVIWMLSGESDNAGSQTIEEDLCRLVRSLDPSRLILAGFGGVHGARKPPRYVRPYSGDLQSYDHMFIHHRAPVDYDSELYFMHSGHSDRLSFLSAFGFGGMEDLPDVLAEYGERQDVQKQAPFLGKILEAALDGFAERELDRVFGNFGNFTAQTRELQCDGARYQLDALRANPKLAGYCYTRLCDGGPVFCAGVMDRLRRPKPVLQTLKEAQGTLRPLIQLPRTNLAPNQEVPVTVTLLNEARIEGRVDFLLQVIGPTNQVLWKKKRNIKLSAATKEVWSGIIAASGSPGTHKFVACLLQDTQVLAENAVELHVFKPVKPCDVEINVVDPVGVWKGRCLEYAKPGDLYAPVHVFPPLANTIRAYPEADLAQVLAQVEGGAVALFFGPPDDWNDLAASFGPKLRATSKDAIGPFSGVYHYTKLHPVFEGLPARGLMRQPYRNTVPVKSFLEPSDEDICGAFDTALLITDGDRPGEAPCWQSDILVRRYGSGRVVFTHLRVLENLGDDPVAAYVFVNMLKHFSRRSVPSKQPLPINQRALEWLRSQRANGARLWMVVGAFPNWNDAGHDTVYPPEERRDFSETYTGWFSSISWKRWHSRAVDGHAMDLQAALTPAFGQYPCWDYGVGYAYAEFSCERRQAVAIRLGVQDAMKVWLNGTLVYESRDHLPHGAQARRTVEATVRQGRNTLLVKVSKVPGVFRFSLDFESRTAKPLDLKWWR